MCQKDFLTTTSPRININIILKLIFVNYILEHVLHTTVCLKYHNNSRTYFNAYNIGCVFAKEAALV